MKKFEITENNAQKILSYITQTPTGQIPLAVALEIVEILTNLKEKQDA